MKDLLLFILDKISANWEKKDFLNLIRFIYQKPQEDAIKGN